MAVLINEQQMIENNTFLYEERIKSPTSRFLDTAPTFVTYYHINIDETTTDEGFMDVETLLGTNSPLRFNKIENFPIYGMEQVVLQLQEQDAGIDTSYESECIVLPNTIKPVPNDFFMIPILHDDFIFRVIDIQYDTVMPNNFYKINYKLEYIDSLKKEELTKQTLDEYKCILENIGTENNCILEKSCFTQIHEIEEMYSKIREFYKAMFYNERHNVFLGPLDQTKFIYDPLQSDFINKHSLFNEKNDLQCLILTDQVEDPRRMIKYAKSVYKLFELRDLKLLSTFKYITKPGCTVHESSFYRWHERRIEVLDLPIVYPMDAKSILSEDYVNSIKLNLDTDSKCGELLKKFVRNEELRVKDISLDLDEELLYFNNSLEVFFIVPLLMYTIKEIIKNEIKITKTI